MEGKRKESLEYIYSDRHSFHGFDYKSQFYRGIRKLFIIHVETELDNLIIGANNEILLLSIVNQRNGLMSFGSPSISFFRYSS